MIYSKFQSRLTPISKTQDAGGRITIQATADDAADVHEYLVRDLKADDGFAEINAIVEKLPWKVFKKQERRRPSVLRAARAHARSQCPPPHEQEY